MFTGLIAAAMLSQGPAPEAICVDLRGQSVVPLARREAGARKATVLIFYIADCPISNKYTPEINRIFEQYSKKGVKFFMIHEDLELKASELEKKVKEFGLKPPVLIDKWRTQMRMSGATMSPECAVYDSKMNLRYLGRIDDRWITLGNMRPKPTKHDLIDAIDAALSGRTEPVRRTQALGCVLPKVN